MFQEKLFSHGPGLTRKWEDLRHETSGARLFCCSLQKKVDFTPKVVSKFALRKAFQMSKNRFRSPDDFTEQSIKKLKLWKTCFCFKIRPSQVGSVTRTIKKWPPYWGSRWKYQTKRYLATRLKEEVNMRLHKKSKFSKFISSVKVLSRTKICPEFEFRISSVITRTVWL